MVTIYKLSRQRIIRLGRESIWLIAGQFLGFLGSLAMIRVITQYLLPTAYGQLALILTVGVLVCQVSMSGVMPGIMRFFTIAVERGDVSKFTAASFRLMCYGVLVTVALACIIVSLAFLFGYTTWITELLLAIVFTQISSFNSTLSAIQNSARQRDVVVLHGIFDPWVKIGLLTQIVFFFGKSILAVILAYIISGFLQFSSQIFFFWRLKRRFKDCENPSHFPWLREMLAYSKPFMIFNLFTWMQANSDRWVLEKFSNSQVVGQYAVLTQLGNTPVTMSIALITNLIGPILQQRSGDATDPHRNRNVWRITWLITFLGLVLTITGALIAYAMHNWLFDLLVAEPYRIQSYLLPWVMLGGGLFACSQVLGLKIMSDLNTRLLAIPKVTTSLLAIGLNAFGAWFWGLKGIVGASILFSLTIFFWMAILTRSPHYTKRI